MTPRSSRQITLADASLGEFIHAKVDALDRGIDEWLNDDDNVRKATAVALTGFSALAASTETAANLLNGREGRKGQMQRGALHAATLGALAGAGAALVATGILDERKK